MKQWNSSSSSRLCYAASNKRNEGCNELGGACGAAVTNGNAAPLKGDQSLVVDQAVTNSNGAVYS